jgi:hypothetical protein
MSFDEFKKKELYAIMAKANGELKTIASYSADREEINNIIQRLNYVEQSLGGTNGNE